MSTDLIYDRGRGPEIVGTRITVYNLLPHFMDPMATESHVCQLYGLTPQQVAAARAYVLNNPETVLTEHKRIEDRMAVGNPPEVMDRARQTHDTFVNFKKWLVERHQAALQEETVKPPAERSKSASPPLPTFREWLAHQDQPPVERP